MHPLAKRLIAGDERALAQAISVVENDGEDKLTLLKELHSYTGKAHYIGLTGSPGAGKSSLVNRLISHIRSLNLTVAIVAVDPTSPFSGGALLGDRVRMAEHFTDRGVFIRSMGTRGSLGGLARATKETVRLMDAFGFDVILIETVGVGQSELDIMKIADTTAVVLNPGSGDIVQIFKAGIMEIADLYVINKADLPGVPKLLGQLESLLEVINHDTEWKTPVVQTISTQNENIDELWRQMEIHKSYLNESGERAKRRNAHMQTEVYEVAHGELFKHLMHSEKQHEDEWLQRIAQSQVDPYSIAEEMVTRWLNNRKSDESEKT
jgi:LAO/AO transport system kinase